jgi:hypothetical protein
MVASAIAQDALPQPAQPEPPAEEAFSATAEVTAEAPGETRLPAERTRDVPGALGDPLRVLDALPGTTPMANGLPYGYVRGAPPATLGYSYDDIRLPGLYHFALGPSVLHPRMLGALHFHPGVAPARFGRRLGGELSVDGPARRADLGGELELRLLDVNGYVHAPIDQASVSFAGRYGYPGILLELISPETTLAYWDYQARAHVPLRGHTAIEVVALGAHDALEQPPWDQEDRFESIELQFHRLELRLLQRWDDVELGSALRVGVDRSSVDSELAVDAVAIGPRMWFSLTLPARARLHAGADFQGSVGEIDSATRSSPLQVAGRRELRLDLPLVAEAAARSAAGGFLELHVEPSAFYALDLGARSDLWIVDGDPIAAVDPRARFTVFAAADVELHAAAGMTHQPAVYMLPLPGLTEVALDRGLQEGLQAEAGVAIDLVWDLRLELQAFVHHYARLLLPELYAPDAGVEAPTADAFSYGFELMLLRAGFGETTGWVAYTLGFAEAEVARSGAEFAPEFDVRHVLNVVLQQRLGAGFSAGGRLHARSGRPYDQFDPGANLVYELRLPAFVRVDARVSYDWTPSWGSMQVYLEWLNLTLAQESLGAECFFGACRLQRAPAIYFPNAGVRAGF